MIQSSSRTSWTVLPLISDDARFWFTNGRFEGVSAVRRAFEATYDTIREEKYTISDVKWPVATYWNSVCAFNFRSDGVVAGARRTYEGYGTCILKRLNGSWRIVHEHLSNAH